MAEEYRGKVAWCIEQERLYAIPDEVQDNLVNPDLMRTVKWIDDTPDDPDSLEGHFELVPEDEDEYPLDAETVGSWDMGHRADAPPEV